MLTDDYGLALSTTLAACDAYLEGARLALTLYPGALEAFDRAIDFDPGFALAHVGRAQVLMRQGDASGARAAITAAKACPRSCSEREASHLAFFELAFSGRTEEAIAALYPHLQAWPRDALIVSVATNPNGLIAGCGRIGQKRRIAELMDALAPHYGDDAWFQSYHATALSEDGRLAAARQKIERSVAANPHNAHAAHGLAHVCYESGELPEARAFLASWLATYPHDGAFHGHLSWHLALCEIEAGASERATALFHDAILLDHHSGGPQQRLSDGAGYLWRSELAGHPRDAAAWHAIHDYARHALPRPGNGLADLHVILAQVVAGRTDGPEARSREIQALAQEGRYASGDYLPALTPGFAAYERADYPAAIEALAPLAGQAERIGGSRAQHDLVELTLLRACLAAGRIEEAKRLISARRPGAKGLPVAGIEALR